MARVDWTAIVLSCLVIGAINAKECNIKKAGSKLFCYYGVATPGVVDTCRCSHVVLPANSDAESIDKLKDKRSHAKLLLTVNEFNEALVNTLKTTKVDGLEINLKKLDSKSDIADFISTVRGKLGADLYLALSVPAKTETLAKYYDFKALSKNVDAFVLQTHLLGVSRNVTFHPSRLSGVWDVQNTDSVVDLVSGLGAPLSKLVITAPVQAFKFDLQNENHTAPGSPALELSTLTRDELCDVMAGDKWTLERDQDQAGPYVFRGKQWISFEDPTSMDIKAKYSRVRGLAGVALKDLSQDGGSKCGQSLLEAVHEGLSKQSRAPRGAVLHSLEREILDAPASGLFQNVKVSPYRITRVIDVEGKVHAIRQDTRTEFECSRQGYFVHPRSCGRFYRCVKFDQQTDEFNVFEFDCPAGLVFDNRVEVCVWPGSLSDTSACSGSSEIAPVPKGRFTCPGKAGYYADPENCRWFFACMDHGQDPISAYEFRCPYGLVFDEDNLLCQWPWLVPKCASGLATIHGEDYTFGGLGLGSFALDVYDGLGQLHGVKLGGLSGPLNDQIARTYSSFGGEEFGNGLGVGLVGLGGYNGTGFGLGSGTYSTGGGFDGYGLGSGLGAGYYTAGLESGSHAGLQSTQLGPGGLALGEYQSGSGLISGGYQSGTSGIGAGQGSTGYTVGIGGLGLDSGSYGKYQSGTGFGVGLGSEGYSQNGYQSGLDSTSGIGAGQGSTGYTVGIGEHGLNSGSYDKYQSETGFGVGLGAGYRQNVRGSAGYNVETSGIGSSALGGAQYQSAIGSVGDGFEGYSKDQLGSSGYTVGVGGIGLDGSKYQSSSLGSYGQYKINGQYGNYGGGNAKLVSKYGTVTSSGVAGGVYKGTTVSPIYGGALGKSLNADKLLLQKDLGQIRIVAGGSSGVVPGVEILQHGVNLGGLVTQTTTASSIPTVTSVPIPVASTTDFEVYRGGVVANLPDLQYKLESPGTINEHLSALANLSYVSTTPVYVSSTPAPTLLGQELYGQKYVSSTPAPTLLSQDYVSSTPLVYVSSTPAPKQLLVAPTHDGSSGYHYQNPAVSFVEVPSTTVASVPRIYLPSPTPSRSNLTFTHATAQKAYVQPVKLQTYQFQKPVFYKKQRPVVGYQEGAAVSFQDIRKTVQVPQVTPTQSSITYHAQQEVKVQPALAYRYETPSVTLQQTGPTVEYQEGHHYEKPAVAFEGYQYQKPSVAFEETKVATQPAVSHQTIKQVVQPSVTYQEGYHYEKPSVTFEETKVAVQPAVSHQTIKQVVQPSVAYQEGYHYQKPAVAFEEGKSAIAYQEVTQPIVQPAVEYHYQKPSVVVQETKVAVQPTVAYQEVKHEVRPALVEQVGYQYQKPAVAFEETKVQVQPAVAYQEVKQVVQPAVAYQEVKHEGYHYQKPAVAFEEGKVAVQPTVAFQEVNPAVAYQEVKQVGYHYQKPAVTNIARQPTVAFQEVKHEIQPAVAYQEVKQVGYHYQKPAVAFEETKVAVQPTVAITHEVKPAVTYQNIEQVGYDYPKPAVAFEETKIKVQPTVAYQEVKPAVTYHEVQNVGYHYQKPAAQPAVTYQSVTHEVKPAVAYQKTEQVGYHYEKPAVAFEDTKVQVQPTVAYQEVKHVVQPAVEVQQVGYHYQKPTVEAVQPAVAYQEVRHEVKPAVAYQEVQQVGYHYQKPAVQPTVAYQEVKHEVRPTVGYQKVKQVGYHYQKPSVAFEETKVQVQPAVAYQEVEHKVQPAVAYQEVKHEGYHYQKPAVAFEETKVAVQPAVTYQEVKQEVQPAVAYQEVKQVGYHYQKPAVQPTVAYQEVKHEVQPAVAYQEVKQVGYQYQKPAVQSTVAYQEVKHKVQPAVTYQEVQQVGYHYQKPAVAFEETKVAVQPAVAYQEVTHEVKATAQPSVVTYQKPAVQEVQQVGYQYQKPAVAFEETKITVQPTVAYQEIKHEQVSYQKPAYQKTYHYQKPTVQPTVAYQEVKAAVHHTGYQYQQPSVAIQESYHYQKPQVAFVEQQKSVSYNEVKQRVQPTQPTLTYQFEQPAPTYKEVLLKQPRPAVVTYHNVKPSVASYSYEKPAVVFEERKQVVSTTPVYQDTGYQYKKPSVRFEERPAVHFDFEEEVRNLEAQFGTKTTGYTYEKPAVAFEEEEVKEELIVPKKAFVTYKESRPIARYEFSSFDSQYSTVKPTLRDYVTTTPATVYLPVKTNKEYLPPTVKTTKVYLPPTRKVKTYVQSTTEYLPVKITKEYLPVKTTKEYLPPTREYLPVKTTKEYLPPVKTTEEYLEPTTEYLPVKITKEYLPVKTTKEYLPPTREYLPVKTNKEYLPPATVRTPSRRPKTTTPAYVEVTTPQRRKPGRVYLPTPTLESYQVANSRPGVKVTKSKSIIKVNDFHPILSAKLGAQCTCVSNTLTLRKKPKALTIVEDEPTKASIVVEDYKYQDEDEDVEPTIDDLEYVKTVVRPEPKVDKEEIVQAVTTGLKLVKDAVKEGVAEAFDRYGPGGTRGRSETLQGTVDCQRAGLFRHPKHCNKFYECRWDCYKKKFTLHVFNCPIHLTFDNTLGACNWPSQGPVCVDDTLLPSD